MVVGQSWGTTLSLDLQNRRLTIKSSLASYPGGNHFLWEVLFLYRRYSQCIISSTDRNCSSSRNIRNYWGVVTYIKIKFWRKHASILDGYSKKNKKKTKKRLGNTDVFFWQKRKYTLVSKSIVHAEPHSNDISFFLEMRSLIFFISIWTSSHW